MRSGDAEPTTASRASRPMPTARASVTSISRTLPPAALSVGDGSVALGAEDVSGRFAQLMRGMDALMQASATEFMLHATDPALTQAAVPLASTAYLQEGGGGSAAASADGKASGASGEVAASARPAPITSVYSFTTALSDSSASASLTTGGAVGGNTIAAPPSAADSRRASLQPRVPALIGVPPCAAADEPPASAVSSTVISTRPAVGTGTATGVHASVRGVSTSPSRATRRTEEDIILTTTAPALTCSANAAAGAGTSPAAAPPSTAFTGSAQSSRAGGALLLSPAAASAPRGSGAVGVRSPMGALVTASVPTKPLTAYYDELARRFAGNSFVQDTMRTLKQHAANSSGNALDAVQDMSARADWPFDALLNGFPPANKRTSTPAQSTRKLGSNSVSPGRRSVHVSDAVASAAALSGRGGRDNPLTPSAPAPASPTSHTPSVRLESSSAAKRLSSRLSVRVTFGGDVLGAAAAQKEDDVRTAAPTAPPAVTQGRASSGGSGGNDSSTA